jgi:hypothetical protein
MTGILTAPMLPTVPALIAELRADAAVAALVGTRVRGGEPSGRTDTDAGDARGPGEYIAFVVVVQLDSPPHISLPIQRSEIGVNCYGTTFQNASAVWGAVVAAMHGVGERIKANGLGIYLSHVEGGSQETDPDTKQPVVRGTIRMHATAQAVT